MIKGARILVAESDPILLADLAAQLRELGFDVEEAETGSMALHLLDYPDDIDLIVTSLGIAGADGMEVASQARTHGQPVPVVFASGRHDLSSAQAPYPARSLRLSKPYDMVDLRKAIDDLLARPRA